MKRRIKYLVVGALPVLAALAFAPTASAFVAPVCSDSPGWFAYYNSTTVTELVTAESLSCSYTAAWGHTYVKVQDPYGIHFAADSGYGWSPRTVRMTTLNRPLGRYQFISGYSVEAPSGYVWPYIAGCSRTSDLRWRTCERTTYFAIP